MGLSALDDASGPYLLRASVKQASSLFFFQVRIPSSQVEGGPDRDHIYWLLTIGDDGREKSADRWLRMRWIVDGNLLARCDACMMHEDEA